MVLKLKTLTGLVFACALSMSPVLADVLVRIGPPHFIVERREHRPSREHVWVSGYHRWDGNAYNWSPGRWEQPPRGRGHWVAHRWVHHRDGWVLVEGHWR
jgi:hypothetical protein